MPAVHSFSVLLASVLLVIPFYSGLQGVRAVSKHHHDIFARRSIASIASNSSSNKRASTAKSSKDYILQDTYEGAGFLTGFEFETFPDGDPTRGRVNYVNEAEALLKNLASVDGSTFTMRADDHTNLTASGPGRDSIRIKSRKAYETHLAVFDIAHMPVGCGTWPAVWETDDTIWPNGGEVDIVEGVNDVGTNQMTLHTSGDCTMDSSSSTRGQTGDVVSTDCFWEANYNEGCGVKSREADSFGPNFNARGGGWYVVERNDEGIYVWFWSRTDSSVPSAVKDGSYTISSSILGIPNAAFPSSSTCNVPSKFGPNNIIINLTFCGDYAGNSAVYEASGCPGTCVDYVNYNPEAFSDAYWTMNSVMVDAACYYYSGSAIDDSR